MNLTELTRHLKEMERGIHSNQVEVSYKVVSDQYGKLSAHFYVEAWIKATRFMTEYSISDYVIEMIDDGNFRIDLIKEEIIKNTNEEIEKRYAITSKTRTY